MVQIGLTFPTNFAAERFFSGVGPSMALHIQCPRESLKFRKGLNSRYISGTIYFVPSRKYRIYMAALRCVVACEPYS